LTLNPDGTLKDEYVTMSGKSIPLLKKKNILGQQEKDGLVLDHSDAH